MKSTPFASEADLCAAFIRALDAGWTAYPETDGWDILLVRTRDGFQIGIEAKLKLNAKVLVQAIDSDNSEWKSTRPGPDCRAILVPDSGSNEIAALAAYIGVTVIRLATPMPHVRTRPFDPALPTGADQHIDAYWREWCPKQRVRLPEYVPDVTAGASGPTQLTDWKIKAIKIAVLLDRFGAVSRDDFRALRIDHRRWIAPGSGWLEPGPDGGWVRGHYTPDLKAQHPVVYEQIAADAEKWMPARSNLVTAAQP